MKRLAALTAVLLVLICVGVLLPTSNSAPPSKNTSAVPLNVSLYGSVVDEHNTTAFYNNGVQYCSGSTTPLGPASCSGDGVIAGPTTAYDLSPWTTASGLTSSLYSDQTDCGTSCLRANLGPDLKILNLDTRGTSPAHAFQLDFTHPCTDAGCPPAGSPTVFGGHLTTPALLNIMLSFPYTSMQVCTSAACPEAQPAFAKLWFTDPSDSSVTWRIDWKYLRILRMSQNTWYVVADACDGTQIAGLSKLQGSRTRPKEVFNGTYKIPFFLAGTKK